MSVLQIVLIALVLAALGLAAVAYRLRKFIALVRNKARGENRDYLWNLLYSLDWTGTTTNNYGYAPAETSGAERFQLQIYAELLKLHAAKAKNAKHTDLLEVSCGQGGGLAHLVQTWPSPIKAIGMDKSENAVGSCRRSHAQVPNISFAVGDALAIPFADASFDVVVNVEASGDYGDYEKFFSEVHRVLRNGGVFLYTDTCKANLVDSTMLALTDAGFKANFRDIAPNVVAASIADTPRRLDLIKTRVPFLYRWLIKDAFENYAAVEGSGRLEKLKNGRLAYLMTKAERV